jgi:Ca2+-binding EF-hand superfamily protein
MMDYYSQFDMPGFEIRKNDLIDYAKTLKHNLSDTEIETIVNTIVSNTKKYSMTGYGVFGQKEERDQLVKAIG